MRRFGRVLLTAGLAAAGGALFAWLGLPAAWLAGAMVATAAAALADAPLEVPPSLRNTAFVLLGVSMGAAVTPESVAQMTAWPLSIVLLAASIVATVVAGTVYLERVHGWDPPTARFSSIPGALSAVLILAASSAADVPRVALAQSIRLFMLVAVMPWLLELGSGAPAAAAVLPPVSASVPGVLAMLAASAVGAWAFQRVRMPGGVLLGAMVASAILHGTGLVVGRPPLGLLITGFVATGAVIGTRFRGTSFAVLRATLRGAIESVLLALLLSAGFAALGARLLGLPFGQLWLAYAPGGVEAMAVMALALGLDAAFVGAHHVVRFMGLNLLSPWWRRNR
jgi:membrane AbrB-like protein